jgi:hypothetical protein
MTKKYVHEDITMLIIDDHPHAGELCHPVGNSPDGVNELTGFPFNEPTYEVVLEDCKHGTDSCFVSKSQLQLVCAPASSKDKRKIKEY